MPLLAGILHSYSIDLRLFSFHGAISGLVSPQRQCSLKEVSWSLKIILTLEEWDADCELSVPVVHYLSLSFTLTQQ